MKSHLLVKVLSTRQIKVDVGTLVRTKLFDQLKESVGVPQDPTTMLVESSRQRFGARVNLSK